MSQSRALQLVTGTVADAEAAVIGALLIEPDLSLAAIQQAGMTWRHFGIRAHAYILGAVVILRREGASIDPIAVNNRLEVLGKLAEVGEDTVYRLWNGIPTAANVSHHARIVRDAAEVRAGDLRSQHEAVQAEQVQAAIERLDVPEAHYLRFPYRCLDEVMGPQAPGSIGFLCARSAAGKTSLLLSVMQRWHAHGDRIYYAGLESRPLTLRTQWACRAIGVNPSRVISGEYRTWRNADEVREAVRTELNRQTHDREMLRVRFSPHPRVDLSAMTKICVEAAEFGAQVVIVDHIDHIKADGSPYAASRAVVDVALELAHRYDLHLLLASQINREGMANDAFRNHRPIREEHVKMGDHKMEVADYMLGVFRPLRDGLTDADRKDFQNGKIGIGQLLQPATMRLNVMKHRLEGSRQGAIITLGFAYGEVLDSPQAAEIRVKAHSYTERSA